MEYRVLGPLSAYLDGVPRTLGGRRQRMVLAVLLARANTVVGRDTLIEDVWAGEPPEAARPTLHAYVSNLRKALDGQIERQGEGYLLTVENRNLDALRFEDLVESARPLVESVPAEAIAMLQEALGMWRGRAFGDLDGEPALASDVIRLEEARISALELRIQADLILGNHAAVVQELEALTREHPFRERLRAALMLALYRSGRQADALRVYQQTRTFLAEELGIDPTHELQELEEQILNHNPDLDWKPVAGEGSRGERAARGYELREELGRSRFGNVFRGFQNSVGREVTVFAIDSSAARAPRFVRRFESEMQAVSRLEHPHIAPIYDFWRDPEGAFIVIPFLAGGSLRSSLDSGPWNLSSTMRLVDQVSAALTYAHGNGVVHGALGLDNIVLDEGSNAYICEFGLIDLAGPDGAGVRGAAGDVHDLALVSFAALTSTTSPPTGRIGEIRPDLVALDHVFQRALHTDPGSRYQKPGDFRRALRQVAGADVVTPSPDLRAEVERRNPFKGLRAFHESDAADFYGRDALTEELVEMVAAALLVTVVGPSGSGKSSLVRAGLIPALREDAVPGSRNWLITEMFPGTHPFEELEAALVRVAVDRSPGFFEDLTADERGLARLAKQILTGEDDELLLVIDQFEELFSLVSSESVRSRFLETLVAAATDERSRIRILLTLRADFFDQPLHYSDFAEVMRLSVLPVGPPTDDGLARAIAQPAREVGVDLEPGLVTRIVDDVKGEPGGLPLMQYALTELFAARKHDTLTLDGYHRTGGVLGALGRRAEEIYQHLSDDGKEATRHLFLRLVSVDELADDTRRRVRQTELRSLGINPMVLDDVLQQFGAYRLLSFDRDAATRTPTIEVAHEALIREWARLRTWVEERREDLLIHRRIQVAVRDWEDSDKDPSDLFRGSRLEQALVWQERTDIAISEDEMSFVEAGIDAERREEAERIALEQKAARRRKAVIGVLAGGLLVAGVLGALALDRAQDARVTAALATSRDLASAATDAIDEDPELGVLLSLEAIDATEEVGLDPVAEAISAVRNSQAHMRVELTFPGFQAIAYSPDGASIVTDSPDPGGTELILRDAATGAAKGDLEVPQGIEGRPFFVTFSPSGEVLAVSRDYITPNTGIPESPTAVLDIYDSSTLRHLRTLMGQSLSYVRPSFSKSGLIASAGWDENYVGRQADVWDPATGEVVWTYSSDTPVWWAGFLPDSDILLVSHGAGTDEDGEGILGRIVAFDVITDTELWEFDTPGIDPESLVVSPDGSMVAIANQIERSVQVRRLPDGVVLFETPHQSPQLLAWSPDGSYMAVSGNDGDVTIFDVASQTRALTLTGHGASVWGLEFSPEGDRLASASVDGLARVWNIAAGGSGGDRAVAVNGSLPQLWGVSPDNKKILVEFRGADSQIIDVASGSIEASFPIPNFPATNQDLTMVAGSDHDGRGVLVDGASGDEIRDFGDCSRPVALSPEGGLVLLDSALCNDDGVAESSRVLDVETDEVVIDLGPRPIVGGVFSPLTSNGIEYVVVNVQNALIEVYSLEDGQLIDTLSYEETDDIFFLVASIDQQGRYLGLGTNGPLVVVVDIQAVLEGTPMADAIVLKREGHKGNTPQVNVSSDGIAVSAGMDGFYRAWDIESGDLLWEIRVEGLTDPPSARINRDQTELAYEDADGVIRFTPLDNQVVIERARASVTRGLTDDECTRYLHTDGCGEPGS